MKAIFFVIILLCFGYSCKDDCSKAISVGCKQEDYFKLKIDKTDTTGFKPADYDTVLIISTSKDFNIHYDTCLKVYDNLMGSFNQSYMPYFDFPLRENLHSYTSIIDTLKKYHYKVLVGKKSFLISDIEIIGEATQGGDCGFGGCFETKKTSCKVNDLYVLVYDKFDYKSTKQPVILLKNK